MCQTLAINRPRHSSCDGVATVFPSMLPLLRTQIESNTWRLCGEDNDSTQLSNVENSEPHGSVLILEVALQPISDLI
jgi:hypothetical protein